MIKIFRLFNKETGELLMEHSSPHEFFDDDVIASVKKTSENIKEKYGIECEIREETK